MISGYQTPGPEKGRVTYTKSPEVLEAEAKKRAELAEKAAAAKAAKEAAEKAAAAKATNEDAEKE